MKRPCKSSVTPPVVKTETVTATQTQVPPKKPLRKTWRRVSVSLFGIILIAIEWRWAIGHIYALASMHNDAALTAFTSLTQSAFYVIGVITVFLVTGLTFFSWSQSSTIATNLTQQITQAMKDKEKK